MNDTPDLGLVPKINRPWPISLISILTIIFAVLGLLSFFLSSTVFGSLFGKGTPLAGVALIIAGIANILAAIGYWKMRRWGVYLAITQLVIGVVSIFSLKLFPLGAIGLILPAIGVGIGIAYLPRMQPMVNIRREPLFLIGMAAIILSTILNIVVFVQHPPNIQSLSLSGITPLSPTDLANVKDCGKDVSCVPTSTLACTPTKWLNETSDNRSGQILTLQESILVSGTASNCTITMTPVRLTYTASDALVADWKAHGTSDAGVADLKSQFASSSRDAYKQVNTYLCPVDPNTLVLILNNFRNTGRFVLDPVTTAHCTVIPTPSH